jgi:hypothetical protein
MGIAKVNPFHQSLRCMSCIGWQLRKRESWTYVVLLWICCIGTPHRLVRVKVWEIVNVRGHRLLNSLVMLALWCFCEACEEVRVVCEVVVKLAISRVEQEAIRSRLRGNPSRGERLERVRLWGTLTEIRISLDIWTSEKTLVVFCPLYIPQFIFAIIDISCRAWIDYLFVSFNCISFFNLSC